MTAREKYEERDREELIAALRIKDESLADWRIFRDGFVDMHREWHDERERLQKRVANLEAEVMRLGQTCTNYSDKLHYYRIGVEQLERRIKELEAEVTD